jgi:hypothetical protein
MIAHKLLGVAALLLAPGLAHAEWYEAKSTHFAVYSQGKPDKLKDYIAGLERYDSAMRVLYNVPDLGASSSSRVTIFVVPGQDQIERLYGRGGNGVAGFYDARASGSIAFASASNDGESGVFALSAQEVLFHEYAHHFMFTAWPDAPFPTWLVEGFAEFNAPTTIDKDGMVTIGNPPVYRAWGIFSSAMPMKRLMTSTDTHRLGEDQIQALYGRGWLLLHYLSFDKSRASQLTAYLKAVEEGKSSTDAAMLAFGNFNKLDGALDSYANGRLSGWRIPPKLLKVGEIEIRPLTAGETATMPALLRSKRGVDRKTAPDVAALAERLAAPYPNDAGAQNELAEAEYDAGHYEASDAAATRAVAADPKSLHALIYRGMAAMAMAVRDKATDPARWAQVRHWFLAANKLDTENAEPLRLFYESFIAAKAAPTANAQAALLYAQNLAPFDDGLRLTAANVLLHEEKADQARAMLKPLAYDPHGGGLSQFAAKLLDDLDKGGAKQALADMEAKPDGDDEAKKS